MQIKETANEWEVCASPDHYFNLIVGGKCFSCGAVWGLSRPSVAVMANDSRRFHDAGDFDEDHDDD